MAIYRYQCVSVGMWRGKIKRWNTTFHCGDSGHASFLHAALNHVGWPNPGDTAGDCSGGVASISVYASTGGAPVEENVYFDWQMPSTWVPFTGTAWSGVDPDTPIDASGESALIVVGSLPGLSRTGKPMSTRKYLHAVPSRTAVAFDDPDVSVTDQGSLALEFPAAVMLSPSGVAPTSVIAEPWYGNHQRVRGRRRTTKNVAAQSFSAGVVAGTGVSGSGAASPQ